MELLGSVAVMIGLWLLYLWFVGTASANCSKASLQKSPSSKTRLVQARQCSPRKESNLSIWRQVFLLLEKEVRQLECNQQNLYACTEDWIYRTNSDLTRLRNAVNKLHSILPSRKTQVEDVRKKRLSLHPSMSLAFSIQDGTLRM